MSEYSPQNGRCLACFKNFTMDSYLDETGNCRIHGGGFGQNFDVSKIKQRLAGAGLLGGVLLLLAKSGKKHPR